MDKKEKIKDMLGKGIPAANVALAVGVSDAYISQLLAEPEFAMSVATIRTKDLTLAHDIDSKWDDYEKRLLDRLGELIHAFTKPKEILEALKIINAAKRKSVMVGGGQQPGGNIINLSLPVTIIQNYKINMQGGMVEVDGRSLKPMPSGQLLKALENRNKIDKIEIIQTPKEIGGSDGEKPKLLERINQKSRRSPTEISIDSV